MADDELRLSGLIPTSPNRLYAAWLDERQHSAFSGGKATVQPWVGGRHTGADAYIEGTLIELDTGRKIVMTWRTTDFPSGFSDSHVEILLEPVAGGTRVAITQTGIPSGQADKYKQIWRTNYLDAIKKFFGKPGAMQAAIREAQKARRLPVAGVNTPRPGATFRTDVPRRPPPVEVDDEPIAESVVASPVGTRASTVPAAPSVARVPRAPSPPSPPRPTPPKAPPMPPRKSTIPPPKAIAKPPPAPPKALEKPSTKPPPMPVTRKSAALPVKKPLAPARKPILSKPPPKKATLKKPPPKKPPPKKLLPKKPAPKKPPLKKPAPKKPAPKKKS